MSRHIQSANPENRKLDNDSQRGKLILTFYKGRAVSLLLQDGILISVQVIDTDDSAKTGEIYIGKIKNVLHNINACFVEIGSKQICYLPLEETASAFLLNRKADGRILAGDELPVQVKREALKTKQAAVTTAIEQQNDYFVFKTGNPRLGISGKLSKNKAAAIRQLFEEHGITQENNVIQTPKEPDAACLGHKNLPNLPTYGVIVRTNCENLGDETLLSEYRKARDAFLELYHKARYRSCFRCIRRMEAPVLTAVRQISPKEYEEIITDVPEFYEELLQAVNQSKDVSFHCNLRLYADDSLSLGNLYGLSSKLEEAVNGTVWLKSGANLVIEQTECLSTIDVNTGKNITGKETEAAIFKVNKEAAEEAARQIRLRNLSGIIIIDFINMKDKTREDELINYLKELTSRDPIQTTVVDMTPLGLMELTRKKTNKSLKEQLS